MSCAVSGEFYIRFRMNELTVEQMREEPSAARILQRIYLVRAEKNPSYSVRAFARSLGVSQTLLSLIFSNKRSLSVRQALRFATRLGMTQAEKTVWFEIVQRGLPDLAKGRKRLQSVIEYNRTGETSSGPPALWIDWDAERFQCLSQWYHVAIMDFSQVKGFRDDPEWIATKLGIHPLEAQDAIERLIRLGLMNRQNGKLAKTHRHLSLPTKKSLPAVREFHRQMSQKAIAELERDDPESYRRRKISGTTIAVRADRLEEAFRRIDRFRLEMADLLSDGPADSLFHLNVQLFPLVHAEALRVEKDSS